MLLININVYLCFMKLDNSWLNEKGLYSCPVCKKEFSKKGIITHIWRKHEEGVNHKPTSGKTITIWNKGLTKETSEAVNKNAISVSATMQRKKKEGINLGHPHSEETKKLISQRMSLSNKGGRCKWFEVVNPNGINFKVQGTWELKFTSYLNCIDINWIKLGINNSEKSFKWKDDQNKTHTYTPDFYSPLLDKYFEVKGYWWGNDKIKMQKVLEQNDINIEIITKKELDFYLKSVEDRSGDIVSV